MATAASPEHFVAKLPEQSVSLVIGRQCAEAMLASASQSHSGRGILLGSCTTEHPIKLVVEDQELLTGPGAGLTALDDLEKLAGRWQHEAGRRIYTVGF